MWPDYASTDGAGSTTRPPLENTDQRTHALEDKLVPSAISDQAWLYRLHVRQAHHEDAEELRDESRVQRRIQLSRMLRGCDRLTHFTNRVFVRLREHAVDLSVAGRRGVQFDRELPQKLQIGFGECSCEVRQDSSIAATGSTLDE